MKCASFHFLIPKTLKEKHFDIELPTVHLMKEPHAIDLYIINNICINSV